MLMEKQNESAPQNKHAILTFHVNKNTYGLPVTSVVQIIEMVTLTHLPQTPPAIQGLLNFRGQLVPVLDMRARFGLKPRPYGLHTPIILVDYHGYTMGLIIDHVDAVLEVTPADTENTQAIIKAAANGNGRHTEEDPFVAWLAQVDRQIIPVLEANNLLSTPEQAQLEQAMPDEVEIEGAAV